VVNKDWEEISQDLIFYIGDFGNNVSGNRKDLHFKNRKKSLALDVPKIDTLSFSYSNQTDFRNQSPTPATLTVKLLSLQMTVFTYSRNSGNKRTAVYALPKFRKSCRPAERILQYKGLITGATYLPHKIIALATAKCCPHLFIFIRLQQQQFLFRQ
jgi:hypothetical protein